MKIKIANVYSTILKESNVKPVVEKNGRLFIGQLFFEPTDEVVQEVLDEVEIPDTASNVEIAKALFPLNKKHNLLASDEHTFSCNAHWAWMNGLAENLDIDYHIKDSEVVA